MILFVSWNCRQKSSCGSSKPNQRNGLLNKGGQATAALRSRGIRRQEKTGVVDDQCKSKPHDMQVFLPDVSHT